MPMEGEVVNATAATVAVVDFDHSDDGRLIADTFLIAAAPDLLAALEVYLMAGNKEARRLASVKAKAAIAKARGGR